MLITNQAQRIKAIRALPQQRDWLIFREVSVPLFINQMPFTFAELVHMPAITQQQRQYNTASYDIVRLADDFYDEVFITDHATPNWFDASVGRQLRQSTMADEWRPRPITAFLRSRVAGMLRVVFYPDKIEHRQAQGPLEYIWRYDLFRTSPQRYLEPEPEEGFRVLPGTFRSLMVKYAREDLSDTPAILSINRYDDDDVLWQGPAAPPNVVMIRYPISRLPVEFPEGANRFATMAWDETIGRLLLANPKSSTVHVIDWTKRPSKGEHH